jgi:amino acid transporter
LTDRLNSLNRTEDLPRRLGVAALVLMIVAFNAPLAAMAGFVQLSIGFGNGIGAPMSFLVAGTLLLAFSVGFVGMSRFIDEPGAFYRYIDAGSGKAAALAGAFLATAAYVLICAGSYPYMGLVVVNVLTRTIGGPVLSWQVWSIIFLSIITTIGLFRIDLSMKLLGKLVSLEVALVALWEIAVAIRGGPEGYSLSSFNPSIFAHGSPGLGILFAMLTMIGIECGACLSAETKNPERAVPTATYIAVIFLASFYSLGTWCYIVTQGASHAIVNASADPVGSFFSSVQIYLGNFFVRLVSLTLVTSQMVAITAIQTSASRYLFALGRDKVLPSQLARVHPRLQSPHVAIVTNAVVSLLILVAIYLCRIDPVVSYAALTGMGIYFLLPLLIGTSISIVVFFRTHPSLEANVWTRLLAPAVSALAISGLFVLTSLNLKVLVGSQRMVVASIIAVIVIPLSGWMLAGRYRNGRAAVLATVDRP